jgi:fermentation-respiration switch protein FrsA (DUF1100 family)
LQLFEIRWARVVKLTIYILVVLLIFGDVGLAYYYVDKLTRRECIPVPQLPSELPKPEIHHVTTVDELTIEVWYYPSKNGAAIITLGGPGSLGGNLPPVSHILDAGYGVLQVGSRPCAQPVAHVTVGYLEAYDAAAGLKFLLEQPEVNPERIGVYGFSMGAVAAIRAARINPEFTAVLAEGGYHNLGEDIVEADASKPLPLLERIFLYTVAGFFWLQTGINPWDCSPIDDLPLISPNPVFFIYGEHELWHGRGLRQFEAAREPKTLWIVPEGSHGINHLVAPEEYTTRVVEFFNETLLGEESSDQNPNDP